MISPRYSFLLYLIRFTESIFAVVFPLLSCPNTQLLHKNKPKISLKRMFFIFHGAFTISNVWQPVKIPPFSFSFTPQKTACCPISITSCPISIASCPISSTSCPFLLYFRQYLWQVGHFLLHFAQKRGDIGQLVIDIGQHAVFLDNLQSFWATYRRYGQQAIVIG